MYFSVCISALFPGVPVERALARVRAAGLAHYEFWGWWDQDIAAYAAAQRRQGLTPAALCAPFISLTDPARRAAYLDGLRGTIAVCGRLGCKTIISQVGDALPGIPREAQRTSVVEGLQEAAPLLGRHGLTLVIEPLNTLVDHPGYFLWQAKEAFGIIDQVGDDCVKALIDLYHQRVMDDLSVPDICRHIDRVGHFHMAGYPGRHEPMEDSALDYPPMLRALRDAGYARGVGLEYFPTRDADDGLQSLARLLRVISQPAKTATQI